MQPGQNLPGITVQPGVHIEGGGGVVLHNLYPLCFTAREARLLATKLIDASIEADRRALREDHNATNAPLYRPRDVWSVRR